MVKISSPFALIIWKKKKNTIYFLHSFHSLFLVKKYDTFAFNGDNRVEIGISKG